MWLDFRYELIWVGDEQNGQAGDHFRYEIIWVGNMVNRMKDDRCNWEK